MGFRVDIRCRVSLGRAKREGEDANLGGNYAILVAYYYRGSKENLSVGYDSYEWTPGALSVGASALLWVKDCVE